MNEENEITNPPFRIIKNYKIFRKKNNLSERKSLSISKTSETNNLNSLNSTNFPSAFFDLLSYIL